jgi:hypothetical protein
MMSNPFEYREMMRELIYEGKQPQPKQKASKSRSKAGAPPSLGSGPPKALLAQARALHEQIKSGQVPAQ